MVSLVFNNFYWLDCSAKVAIPFQDKSNVCRCNLQALALYEVKETSTISCPTTRGCSINWHFNVENTPKKAYFFL